MYFDTDINVSSTYSKDFAESLAQQLSNSSTRPTHPSHPHRQLTEYVLKPPQPHPQRVAFRTRACLVGGSRPELSSNKKTLAWGGDLGCKIHWRSNKIHRFFPVSTSVKNAEKYIPTSYASSIWHPSKKITDFFLYRALNKNRKNAR